MQGVRMRMEVVFSGRKGVKGKRDFLREFVSNSVTMDRKRTKTSKQSIKRSNRGLLLLFNVSVLILFPAPVEADEQDNFYFDPAPMDQDIVEGGEVRLRCDVSSRKMIAFYWTLNGKQVLNNARRFQDDSDLRILRADRVQDSGSFRCIATNVSTGMALRSTEAKLNIFWIDQQAEVQVKPLKEAETIVEGSEVTLKCQADGHPEPVVEWFRNKIRIQPSDGIRFHKNRLKIVGSGASDNGLYSCKARNTAGSIESLNNFLLNIPGVETAHLNSETFTRLLVAKKGTQAQLHCEYANAVNTEWYANEMRITNDSANRKYIVFRNGTLVVNDVQSSDTGVYRCVGLSKRGPAQNFAAELFLAYLDELTFSSFEPKPTVPVVGPVNSRLEILCRLPRGLPEPTLRWVGPSTSAGGEQDQPSLVGGDQDRVRASEGMLVISNAEESDNGNYTCIAENLAGMTNKSIWIVVSVPPIIVRPPLSTRVTEDDSASFECKVLGTPFPVTTISWMFDDDLLDLRYPRFEVDQISGSLRLSRVTLSDEGNYACLVNTTGHPVAMSTNAHLYVEKRLKFKPIPVNSKLELGSHCQIVCRADGRTAPKVKWYKVGTASLPEEVEDLDGILVFKEVRHSDSGLYTCIASSEQGFINVTINVDVIVKPRFKVRPLNTTAVEGHSAMLHCVAIGDPLPTVQWDRNNKVNSFDFQRFKVLSNGSLSISEVYMEDSGKYGCTAGNSGGFEQAEVFLHVIDSESHQRMRFSGSDGAIIADNFDMMKTIVIAVCSAVAYLAIVIGLTVYCSIRLIRAKTLRKHINSTTSQGENVVENGLLASENTELVEKKEKEVCTIRSDVDARSSSSVGALNSHFMTSALSSQFMQRIFDKLSFPRNRLVTLGMLGKGHYGDVFLAKAFRIQDSDGDETLVMVKSLLSRSTMYIDECLREIDLFSRLNHENVVQLLGICHEAEPVFLVMEYCEWGDLKKFLQATRTTPNGAQNLRIPSLSLAQKSSICGQVALGMEHISNLGLVHRDLAARNIVLSPTLDVKVTSLALSRDIYASEYFLLHQQLIPLRWMSPEAILDGEFSPESDVWSYGIFAWEVFTSGDLPLAHRTNEQVLEGLNSKKNQLPCPLGCPKDIWSLIQTCLADCPQDRPSFSDIVTLVYDILSDGVPSS